LGSNFNTNMAAILKNFATFTFYRCCNAGI